MTMSHELKIFLKNATDKMANDYVQIRNRSLEDPGTAGDQGEGNWQYLLKEWLPEKFRIVTKGRILGASGDASGQVDVLVLSPSYPNKLLESKYYLAGGVVAAFECKNTFRYSHLKKIVENAQKISNISKNLEGKRTMFREMHSPIIYGVLAHSHELGRVDHTAMYKIGSRITDIAAQKCRSPAEMLDLFCISDLGTIVCARQAFYDTGNKEMQISTPLLVTANKYGISFGVGEDVTLGVEPIGALLAHLFSRMAYDYEDLRRLCSYYSQVGIVRGGGGMGLLWSPDEVLSPDVRERLAEFYRKNPADRWDEWNGITAI